MKVIRKLLTGGPISAPATVADLYGDGRSSIIAASDALYAWQADTALLQPGFPVRGVNFFASRPLVVDLYDDGRKAIIVGCDDNKLYGFDSYGHLLPGFPILTGGDVYSSPTAADLDGDGVLEIVVGSDDGCVYIWRADGSPFPGWPQRTGGFVSASPMIADLDGDGRLEILVGSWDRRVYAWRTDGRAVPGWPNETGHFVWSSPQVKDLTGDRNLEVIAASDRVYAWRSDGSLLPGWPQPTTSYVVSQPIVCSLDGDNRMAVLVCADQLYAWDAAGRPRAGFPVDLGTYVWSSPATVNLIGHEGPVICLCGWDGSLHLLTPDGQHVTVALSTEPVFATPAISDFDGDGRDELLVGTWDGYLYVIDTSANHRESVHPSAGARAVPAQTLTYVKEAVAPFISFPGSAAPRSTLHYRAECQKNWHPVPLVRHRGHSTGLIQPFPAGTTVSYWAEIDGQRLPAEGAYAYRVTADWPGRVSRKIRKWLVTI